MKPEVPSECDSPPGSSEEKPVHEKTNGSGSPGRERSAVSPQKIPASASSSVPENSAASPQKLSVPTCSSVPDGLDHVRYRYPDKNSFIFDVTTGYRFDPSTGLHYDANSEFFINFQLGVLLRWDPEFNTYVRAGDFSALGKPLITMAVQDLAADILPPTEPVIKKESLSPEDEGSSMRKSGDDGELVVKRHKRKRSHRKSDDKPDSPERQKKKRSHASRSRHRDRRSDHVSMDREKGRSVSRERNRSKTDIAGRRSLRRRSRSRSRDIYRRSPSRDSRRRSPSRDRRRRSPSRESRRRSPSRESRRRSPSRESRRRSPSRDLYRNTHRDFGSRSPSRDTFRRSSSWDISLRNFLRNIRRRSPSRENYRRTPRRSRSRDIYRRSPRRDSRRRSPSLDACRRSPDGDDHVRSLYWEERRRGRSSFPRRSRSWSKSSSKFSLSPSPRPEAELLRKHKSRERSRCRKRSRRSGSCKKRRRDSSNTNDRSPKRKKGKSKHLRPEAERSKRGGESGNGGLDHVAVDNYSSISDFDDLRDENCQPTTDEPTKCDMQLPGSERPLHGKQTLKESGKVLNIDEPTKMSLEDVSDSPPAAQDETAEQSLDDTSDSQPVSQVEAESSVSSVETKKTQNCLSSPNNEAEAVVPQEHCNLAAPSYIRSIDLRDDAMDEVSGGGMIDSQPPGVEGETSADAQETENRSCANNPSKDPVAVPAKHQNDDGTNKTMDSEPIRPVGKSSGGTSEVVDSIELSDDETTTELTVVDHGDMLAHLFADDNQCVSNILLIAPVPLANRSKDDSDTLRNQLGAPQGLFKVYVNHESTSGSPCHFMVVSFNSSSNAKKWYDSLNGTIELCGGGSKMKGYLHFMQKGNWNCKNCRSFNFFMQSICPKCYVPKDGEFSPIRISKDPTVYVGIAKLKGNFSSGESVVCSLPPAEFNILSTKVMKEPKGLPLGLCVFEVGTVSEAIRLHDFFIRHEKHAVYIKLTETSDELYLDQLFGESSPTNIVHVALIPVSPTQEKKLEPSLMKLYVEMLLKEESVRYDKVTAHLDVSVGAPVSYVLVTFDNDKTASEWLNSRQSKFSSNFIITSPNQRCKVVLHYSESDWLCQGCNSLNFSLRSLCHCCFRGADPNKIGPISQSLTATTWVAVSEISVWSKPNEDIVLHFRELLKEFIFKGTEVIRDPKCPALPLACVFETHDKVECGRLKEYLAKQGKHLVFVDVHKELNEDPPQDPSCDDVMIVDEPPECIDLTEIDDDGPIQPAEKPESSLVPNPKAAANNQPSSVSLPSPQPAPAVCAVPPSTQPLQAPSTVPTHPAAAALKRGLRAIPVPPTDEQPSPLRVSYTVPFKYPDDIITVSPVPHPGIDAAMFYTQLFLNAGADFDYVHFCNGKSHGVPYNYCIVKFKSPDKAKRWNERKLGLMEIKYQTFRGIRVDRFKPMDAYFQFIGANWRCDCGTDNSPVRSVCFKCYTQRGEHERPIENTLRSTRYLGVTLHAWKSANQLVTIFPPRPSMLVNYKVEKILYVGDPMLHRDHGFFVFTMKTSAAAIKLLEFCRKSLFVKSAGFVTLKDPNAGAIIELDFNFTPMVSLRIVNDELDFRSIMGNTNEKPFVIGSARRAICPDYDTFVWTSLFGYYLDDQPTSIVSIVPCPGDRELHQKARAQIMSSLQRLDIAPKSMVFCDKRDHGSPFSYCLVVFTGDDLAKRWFDSCKGTFIFKVPPPVDKTAAVNFQNCFSLESTPKSDCYYFIESKLHYSGPNWLCKCGSSNFPLRTLCHNCFDSKKPTRSSYVVSPKATPFVGIKLTKYFSNLDPANFLGVRRLGIKGGPVNTVRICLDRSFPNDPCGVVIFQTPHTTAATHLFKLLTGLSQMNNESIHIRDTKAVLDSGKKDQIVYIQWNSSVNSNWIRFESDNWDRYFSISRPTSDIAVYHRSYVNGVSPIFNIHFSPFGGRISKFKKGGGFYSTFFMVSFPTPEHAEIWFSHNAGVLKYKSHKVNLYFSPVIWKCRQCGAPNFPARLICCECYEHRAGDRAPLKISVSPTRWVGIPDQVGADIPCKKSKAYDVLSSSLFKFRSVRIICDPVVRQDGPSVLVFEVVSPAIGVELQKLLTTKGITSKFFVVNEPPGADIPFSEELPLLDAIETIVLDDEDNQDDSGGSSSGCNGHTKHSESSNPDTPGIPGSVQEQIRKPSYAEVAARSGSAQEQLSKPSYAEVTGRSGGECSGKQLGKPSHQENLSGAVGGLEQADTPLDPEALAISGTLNSGQNQLVPSAPEKGAISHGQVDEPSIHGKPADSGSATRQEQLSEPPSCIDPTRSTEPPVVEPSEKLDKTAVQGVGKNLSRIDQASPTPLDLDASAAVVETSVNPESPTDPTCNQNPLSTSIEVDKYSEPTPMVGTFNAVVSAAENSGKPADLGSAHNAAKQPSELPSSSDSGNSKLDLRDLDAPAPVVIPAENPEKTVPVNREDQPSANLTNLNPPSILPVLERTPNDSDKTPLVPMPMDLNTSKDPGTSRKCPANAAVPGSPCRPNTPSNPCATINPAKPTKPTPKDAVTSNAMVIPDYETLVWTSVYHRCLISPPSKVVIISPCPGSQTLPDEAKSQILDSIKGAGVNHETIIYRSRREVGSPFSYCVLSFESVDLAQTWMNFSGGTFRFTIRWPKNAKTPINFENCYSLNATEGGLAYYIESKLHYSSPDWVCSCGVPNVSIRSLCHNCYKSRYGESEVVSKSVDGGGPSRFVSVKLAKYFPRLDIDISEVSKNSGCALSKIVLRMDPQLPRDPCGLVVFELSSIEEGIKFFKFLTDPRGVLLRIMKSSSGIVFLTCADSPMSRSYPGSLEFLSKTQTPAETIIVQYSCPKTPLSLRVPYGGIVTQWKQFIGFFPQSCLVHFPNAEAAKKWFDENGGMLKNDDEPQPAILCYIKEPWCCQACGATNFSMRVLCYQCFEHNGNGRSPLKLSKVPTKWVGIANNVGTNNSHKLAIEFLAKTTLVRSIRVYVDPNVRLDGTFVVIFEAISVEVALQLHRVFGDKRWKNSFFIVNEYSDQTVDNGNLSSSATSEIPAKLDYQKNVPEETAAVKELPKDNSETPAARVLQGDVSVVSVGEPRVPKDTSRTPPERDSHGIDFPRVIPETPAENDPPGELLGKNSAVNDLPVPKGSSGPTTELHPKGDAPAENPQQFPGEEEPPVCKDSSEPADAFETHRISEEEDGYETVDECTEETDTTGIAYDNELPVGSYSRVENLMISSSFSLANGSYPYYTAAASDVPEDGQDPNSIL